MFVYTRPLSRGVRLEVAVPVEVVGRDVEAGARQRPQRGCRVQLEARELHGQHVVRLRVQHRLEHGRARVADRGAAQAGGGEHRGEHRHGRGLAVGAGDREPGRAPGGRAHPPGQLHLAPHGDARRGGAGQHRVRGRPAGRRDDDLGRGVPDVRQCVRRPRPQQHPRAQGVEDDPPLALRRPVAAVDDHDRRAALGQRVGGGEARGPDAGHDHAQARPVGAAVRQRLQPRRAPAHWPTTHSA